MVSFLRRMLWFFTPAKSIVVENVTPELSITEERPSPYLSQMGHLTLGLIYSVMLVGYCALLIVNWVNRDSFTEYTTKPVTKYDPMWIQLEVYCTNAPNCGQIRIRQNYDGVGGLPAGCTTADDVVVYNTAPGNTEGKVLVPLCWSDNPLFSTKNFPLNIPGITISFTEINPGRTSKYDNTPNPHFFAQGVIKIYDRTGPGAASGAGKGGVQMPSLRDLFQSSSSSPFRHVISVRTFMYIAALCATIVETSVIQNRDETQIRALSGSELDRLHVAFLVRGIALIAASLMILTNKPLNLSHHLQTRRIREVVVNAPTGGGAGVGASQATLQPPSTSQSMPSNFASRM